MGEDGVIYKNELTTQSACIQSNRNEEREKKVIVAFNIKTQILKNGKIVNYLHGIEHGLQE
jgi:hypothetical protein